MEWNINSQRPVYIQLIEQIELGIIAGYYTPGDKLLSVRDLAAQAKVNPNTMQKALVELERMGLVYANRTSGRTITSDLDMIKKVKEESAMNVSIDYLEKMKKLGFDTEEILSMLQKLIREMNK